MKNDPWRFNSMCCARTAALQRENEKRMSTPCWASCRNNALYPKPEAKIAPRATQDPTKMEPKSTPDVPRRPLRDHLGAMFEKNLILKAPKWPSELQNGAKNETKSRKKRKKNEYQKHSISRHVFFQIFNDFGAIFGVNSRTLESSKMSIWCR